MGTVLVVRHGQASYGKANYDQLSDLGTQQSVRLGAWLADRGRTIDRLVVGPAVRHRQTADGIRRGAAGGGLTIPEASTDDRLAEFPAFKLFAMHAGMELHEAANRKEPPPIRFEDLCHEWMLGTLDCGALETSAAFERRVVSSLDDARKAAKSTETTLLVTSGGPTMAVLKHVLGVPAARASSLLWTIANASLSSYRLRGDQLTLTGFNHTAHLRHADITYR